MPGRARCSGTGNVQNRLCRSGTDGKAPLCGRDDRRTDHGPARCVQGTGRLGQGCAGRDDVIDDQCARPGPGRRRCLQGQGEVGRACADVEARRVAHRACQPQCVARAPPAREQPRHVITATSPPCRGRGRHRDEDARSAGQERRLHRPGALATAARDLAGHVPCRQVTRYARRRRKRPQRSR